MRFRASIPNVLTVYRIIQSVEKLQKKCIIKFDETHMHIICNDRQNEGGIEVWSKIKVESIFEGYRIQSNAGNEITIQVVTEALSGVLKSASPLSAGTSAGGANGVASFEVEEVVMKLAKKNDMAVLTFEVAESTMMGRRVNVKHDVKIEVLKPGDVERLKEPMCPQPDTHILLPPLQKIRTIVDRLRLMSDVLTLSANNNGGLRLSINTDPVQVDTDWKGLTHPKMALEDDEEEEMESKDPEEYFSVHVSTKSFVKFLNSHVVSTTTIACICQHHCMILYVYIGDAADAGGVLTFYIPAIIDGDED